jgi:hypothetical protein
MTQSPAQQLATVASALDQTIADAPTLDERLMELRRRIDGRIAFSTSWSAPIECSTLNVS